MPIVCRFDKMLCNEPATQEKQLKQANCPAVVLFPTTASTIYIQKHKNFRKEQNRRSNCTTNRQNTRWKITAQTKHWNLMKTAKKNRHCISAQNVVVKYPTHIATAYLKFLRKKQNRMNNCTTNIQKLHGERLLLKQNIENWWKLQRKTDIAFRTKRCWKKHRHTRWKETKKQRKRYRFRCFHSIESRKFLHFLLHCYFKISA